ncbi:MAG: hypothetical protein ABIH72_02375 [archaeon]
MIRIGIIGPSEKNIKLNQKQRIENIAEKIGELLAQKRAVILTGGMDGIMEYVAKGAKKFNGLTIGTPGNKKNSSNQYIDIEILSDVDVGSFIFSALPNCDAIITLPGGAGTLAELCIAYRRKLPIVIIKGLDLYYDSLVNNYLDNSKCVLIRGASSPENAVELVLKLAKENLINQKKI